MNLNRYKFKLPSPDRGARPLELVGSWIMFGGLIVFIVLLIYDGYRGNEGLHLLAYVVGGLYMISWFSARHKWVLLVFTLSTFSIPLVSIQRAMTTMVNCQAQERIGQCYGQSDLILIFSIYMFTVFLALFFKLITEPKSV